MTRRYRTLLLAVSVVLSALFVTPLAWAASQQDQTGSDGTLHYQLMWDFSDLTLNEDGGWQTTTNLGYTVQIDEAYVSTYWLQLTECDDHEHNADGSVAGLLDTLLTPGSVYAGHGEDSNDTRSNDVLVENLAVPQASVITLTGLSDATYCGVHYLAGPAKTGDGSTMDSHSIMLSGSYLSPDSSTWVPFSAEWTYADGALVELHDHDDSTAAADTALLFKGYDPLNVICSSSDALHSDGVINPGSHAHVTVTRSLGSLFDGIDFTASDSSGIAQLALHNLVGSVTVTAGH